MDKICNLLKEILVEEISHGNKVERIINNYNENITKAIFMIKPISKTTFQRYSHSNEYKYWEYKGSPQNPPNEGFSSKKDKQVIVFPKE